MRKLCLVLVPALMVLLAASDPWGSGPWGGGGGSGKGLDYKVACGAELGRPVIRARVNSSFPVDVDMHIRYAAMNTELPVQSLALTQVYNGGSANKHNVAWTFPDSVRVLDGDTIRVRLDATFPGGATGKIVLADTALVFHDYTEQTYVFAWDDSATAVAALDTTAGWPTSVDRVVDISALDARYGVISGQFQTNGNAIHYNDAYVRFSGTEARHVMPGYYSADIKA